MGKLTVQVRTRDNLLDLLAQGQSPAWIIGKERDREITHVHVVNWDGTQRLEGIYDPASYRVQDDPRRLVLKFVDAHIVNCAVDFSQAPQAVVRYTAVEPEDPPIETDKSARSD